MIFLWTALVMCLGLALFSLLAAALQIKLIKKYAKNNDHKQVSGAAGSFWLFLFVGMALLLVVAFILDKIL